MNRDVRTVAEFVAGMRLPPEHVRAAATRLLAPRRPKLKPKSRRPAKLAKAAKDQRRNIRMAGIRACVMERADDRCEVCKGEPATEVHHLISGSGLRRTFEDSSTCIALCDGCHRLVHRNSPATLRLVYAWAEKHSNRFALGALERRMDKLARTA